MGYKAFDMIIKKHCTQTYTEEPAEPPKQKFVYLSMGQGIVPLLPIPFLRSLATIIEILLAISHSKIHSELVRVVTAINLEGRTRLHHVIDL